METSPHAFNPSTIASLSAGNDHPIVDLPFTAVIDGRQFRGRGLSLVSAHVVGLLGVSAPGVPRIVKLVFDFDGFAVTLVALADIRDSSRSKGEFDLNFNQPSGPHLPQLRHILNAYIARDLVSLGQVIGVAGTTPPIPAKPRTSGIARQYIQGSALAVLAVALIAVASTLIYQRSFVRLLPELGMITLQGETLRATANGQIAFLDLAAPVGQIALAISTTNGDVLSVTMPCDCHVSSMGLRVGSTVLTGEPILHLSAPDAGVVVQAKSPAALAFDLARGDQVELILPDGSSVPATADAGKNDLFIPKTPLDTTLLGQPVQLRLIRKGGALGQLVASIGQISEYISGKL
jgi:alginate biosynthesis protein Alg44